MHTGLSIARLGRNVVVVELALALSGPAWAESGATNAQALFASPDQAVTALREAAQNRDTNALGTIFGPKAAIVNPPALKNFDAYGNGVLQIGSSGNQSRVISGGLTGLGDMNSYPTAKSLADGSWLLFTIGDVQYHKPSHLVMAKLPPFVAGDSLDRGTFLPLEIGRASCRERV